jgi:hypothetical protein
MAENTPPAQLPGTHVSRLSTKLSLDELNLLTPEIRKELVDAHGLEVRIISRSDRVKELLAKAGLTASPTEATYDKVYDRTYPGYDRVYDRG